MARRATDRNMANGLEGVVAAETRLSDVDGERGHLTIAGFSVDVLAPYATFEQVVHLLLHDRLPSPEEHKRFAADLGARRSLSPVTLAAVREAASAQAAPMSALRMAVATLGLGRGEEPMDDALTAIAALPAIVGAYWRALRGDAPVPVSADLSHAAHC